MEASNSRQAETRREALLRWAIPAGLILSVVAVYAQVVTYEFVDYDDQLYVFKNPHVLHGLTPAAIRWASSAVVAANWIPLTLLSHMLDVQLFGIQPGLHHLGSVFLHALSVVLLFVLLRRATASLGASAMVAFMFAVHPLHVESVAWIAERKDVLSGLFWFLATYCYVRYAEEPSMGWYLAVAGAFCLGVMSKPMLVTLPFTLLLLDFWPLRRARFPEVLWEKLPLIVLSAAASTVTYLVQRTAGAVNEAIGLDGRLYNGLISCFTYIRQTIWPVGLAVIYPLPNTISAWKAGVALVLLLGVTALILYYRRSRPYLAVGWLWYLGTLLPVLGVVVQVGNQSHADRYTYIPMVGLSLMLAGGASDLIQSYPQLKLAILVIIVLICSGWTALAWRQTTHWQNTGTLFEHALQVTQENWVAENALGAYLANFPERRAESVEHFEAALRIKPDSADTNNNLGAAMLRAGLCRAAIPHFQAALETRPTLFTASNNMGVCLASSDNPVGAVSYFEMALRDNPDYGEAHLNLARTLLRIPGHTGEAATHFEEGLGLDPSFAGYRDFGILLRTLGRKREALLQFEAAQRLEPDPDLAKDIDNLRQELSRVSR
jgi:tetratricopeptide (TPR) repeat protein